MWVSSLENPFFVGYFSFIQSYDFVGYLFLTPNG